MNSLDHERFMNRALELAKAAAKVGEVPVGAVIVKDGQIIAEGANARESEQSPLGHAELAAIAKAAAAIGSWRLEDTTLYVTLEPCPMCAGAILNARIPNVFFGCTDSKAGAVRSLFALLEDPRLNHRCAVQGGVLADSASQLLTTFFSSIRRSKQEATNP